MFDDKDLWSNDDEYELDHDAQDETIESEFPEEDYPPGSEEKALLDIERYIDGLLGYYVPISDKGGNG